MSEKVGFLYLKIRRQIVTFVSLNHTDQTYLFLLGQSPIWLVSAPPNLTKS